ncbi:30S ribosomal protein S21 2 [Holospora elegans E1]|uniref:Small ribosomal subunit protein bS21 n=1 Tax=Holospora elegans E1 TaxID=1427503 RepID=A0A023DYD2_9PROT|nr:30S ribosomal protein S21 [Holospora elegans]GAJ46434.1 30S ribosomal protein S21 2 [Holospora elegans E1]
MAVVVKDGNVEKALIEVKRRLQLEGLVKEIRKREAYIQPSKKRKEQKKAGRRRLMRALSRRMAKDGF